MTSTITPIKTIVEPVGISNSDEMIKPANIENSENSIEYKIVFLKLLPIGILVATGMISNPETSNTPIISIKIEITIASITVINIEYTQYLFLKLSQGFIEAHGENWSMEEYCDSDNSNPNYNELNKMLI